MGILDGLLNSSRDMKAPSKAEMDTYKDYLKSLTAEQKKAERSRLAKIGNNNVARNRYIRMRGKRFASATTKTVKKMGGQQKEGALAKGGSVKKKMAYGGKAMPKKKMMGGGKVMPKKKMMHGGKVKKK